MLRNYIKIALRNLSKNKVFVLINVFGLGIALACCIVAFLNWEFNKNFDAQHVQKDNIYRINFIRITNGKPIQNGSCPLPLGATIRENISQIENVVRYYPIGGNFKVEDNIFNTWVSGVDPEFFETFTFNMVAGQAKTIQDKRTILISSELQEKYFPTMSDPVGSTMTYINGDIRIDFRVGGVFTKMPLNSSFFAEAYVHYDNVIDVEGWNEQDWSLFNSTFVSIPNPADVSDVENQLQQYVAIQNQSKEDYKVERYYLDPFDGMAIRAEKEGTWNHWFQQSLPVAAASAPGIMALLILLIACFNFTNTSIAIANRRIEEIGIRKVLGAKRKQIVFQFLGENLFMAFLALLAGLLMAAFLVPAYSSMWAFLDIRLNLIDNLDLLLFLAGLLIFTGLVAGSYPAFYVSRFQPDAIFRGKLKFRGTNTLTRILLTIQFAISLVAIISGFVFSQNATYQANYDMGFNMESVVYAHVKNESGFIRLRNELLGNDIIRDMAGSRHCVTTSWYTDPIKFESSELDVSILDVGSNYLNTIGATLIEGRDFRDDSQTDVDESVIINQELVRTLGWEDPIGKLIVLRDTFRLNVIGVVKDIFIDGALWEPLEPMLMRYVLQDDFRFLSVKAQRNDIAQVKSLMEEKWKVVFPEELSSVQLMEEEKAASAEVNINIKIIFLFLGLVAVLLSVIGLFSLVSLNIIKRMKEIGIRKVLGASIGNITIKISKEFIIILLIASIMGTLAGYYLATMLMESIWTYNVPIRPIVLVVSISILFIISIITIGGKIFRAATVNPAEIIQDE